MPALYNAGLSDARTVVLELKYADLSINVSAFSYHDPDHTIVKGDDAIFGGYLTDVDTGDPLEGRTVELIGITEAGIVGSDVTDVNGYWEVPHPMPLNLMAFEYQAHWSGDAEYNDAYSPVFTLNVEERVPLSTFDIYPTACLPGTELSWQGDLRDPKLAIGFGWLAGRDIYLQESVDQVDWYDVAGPRLTNDIGFYAYVYNAPSVEGTYYYRARFLGDSPGSLSNIVRVEVLGGSALYNSALSRTVPVQVGEPVPPPGPFPWWLFGLMGVIVGVPILYFLVAKPKGKEIA